MIEPSDLLEAGETARRTIPAVVRALMAAQQVSGAEVAAALGMSPSSFYARLNSKSGIAASEVATFARFFDVPVSFFYDPPVGLLKSRNSLGSWTRHREPALAVSA